MLRLEYVSRQISGHSCFCVNGCIRALRACVWDLSGDFRDSCGVVFGAVLRPSQSQRRGVFDSFLFWMHIFEAPLPPFSRAFQSREPSKISRVSFVAFNTAFDGLMFLFCLFLLQGAAWSWVFVLGTALIGVGNGVLHCGTTLLKRAYFSGCISAIFTLVAGSLTLAFTTVRI